MKNNNKLNEKKTTMFGVLQQIGQSLMIPVSVLPAAGIMVAIGRMMLSYEKVGTINYLGQIFFSGGLAVFEQLPLVFAVGVAIGFTSGAGVAGLSAVVGYFTLTNVIKAIGVASHLDPAINTGVFGGIAIGLIAALLYNRYSKVQLNPIFGFFSGKRLVPIISTGAAICLGLALGYGWPPIQSMISQFGEYVMTSTWGPAFYAAGKRLLIPVGLHHVYYPSFLFEFGQYVMPSGEILHGDSARYFGGDPTAGRFMASEFPIMLFGLPAAALAMYMRAKKETKKAIGGIMLSAALTSILTGITEPIEFSFIFVAPILYVFHVLMAFLSGTLTSYFDIHLGYTFSASMIDFGLGFFNQKNSSYLFWLVGPAIGVTYFSVFYAAIGWLNLKTPGRENENVLGKENFNASEKASRILTALGGSKNLNHIDACITRLRISVNNSTLVKKEELKLLGAAGILDAGSGNYQIIFGTDSDRLKEEIISIIESGASEHQKGAVKLEESKRDINEASTENILGQLTIYSPISGTLLNLDQVPDQVFADGVLGKGYAVDPNEGIVRAPFDGEIIQIFRTGHAVGLKSISGIEVLIHVGIDTVKMQGEGFKALVKKGEVVKKGTKLIEFDLSLVREKAKSTISPVVVTNYENIGKMSNEINREMNSGDRFFNIEIN